MSTERTKFDDIIDPEIKTDPHETSVTMYCLKTCKTCKTAGDDLLAAGAHVMVKDVVGDNIGLEDFRYLEGKVGWEKLLNKSSATWRNIPETDKAGLDRDKALELLVANPKLMKRPALDFGDEVIVGWNADAKERALAKV